MICLIHILLTACATTKTIVETKIEYISPEIPDILLSKCDDLPQLSFQTNGELIMAYISLQSMYTICSSKVTSIANILQSYSSIYTVTPTVDNSKSE